MQFNSEYFNNSSNELIIMIIVTDILKLKYKI